MVKFKTYLEEAAGKGLTMFDVDETMFMTKAKVKVVKDGKVIKNESGKVLKPDTYFKPNIKEVLGL